MTSSSFRLCLCLLGIPAAVVPAQTPPVATPPADKSAEKSAVTESQPAPRTPPPPARRRSISPELSAALAAGVKFEAPDAQKNAQETAEQDEQQEEETDLRETDKPRNTIIRLPKYVVEGERPPVFSEREIHTQKGLADLAMKRYLSSAHMGLNRYAIPSFLGGISSEQLAMIMYRDEERLRNMREFDDKVYLYRQTGDTEAADALQQDAHSTFIRKSEFTTPPRANGK